MTGPTNLLLAAWGNYYVIVGSSGAALIGLQFVVVTLVATLRRRTRVDALNAFGTPTVVNFVGALVIAVMMSAPWHALLPLSIALAAYGVFGVAYSLLVVRRARRQTDYQPVWEDWLWYALLPCASYAGLVLAAACLHLAARFALFGIGAAALGLLLIGIHNAWDSVTHMVVNQASDDETRRE